MRLSTLICCLCLLAAVARAEPVATLVTVGPGDAVWEKFGHNMIRLQDDERGFDVCYNWGLFDFDKPNFIGNFVRGRMVYTMAALRTQPLLNDYHAQNRRVTFQKLDLTPEELNELIVRCETNRRPENADYRYDYFKDNCSTRVRDVIDAATNGKLSAVAKGVPTRPPMTYRSEALRLMQDDFWVSLGVDFSIGPNTDKPLDVWAEGFLPESVAKTAAGITEPPTEMWTSTRPLPPTSPPMRWPGLLAVGLLVAAGVVFARGVWRAVIIGVWWLISGFGGWFMLYAMTTDHTAGYYNQNLWHYSPLAWPALAAMVFRFRGLASRLANLIAALSILGVGVWAAGRFGGPFAQPNGGFILLALPINLVAARVVRPALTKPAVADDMAGTWPTAPQPSQVSP